MDEQTLLNFAVGIGEVMLANGAETHRVEDTVERILSVKEGRMPETFVTPTGFFASIQGPLSGTITKFRRVSKRSINLEKVTRANSLSRDFVAGKVTLHQGFNELERIAKMAPFPYALVVLCYGAVCFSFALLFSGTIYDALTAFFVGIFLGIIAELMEKKKVSPFLVSFFGGVSIAVTTLIFYLLGFGTNYNTVITGCLMPLVPGFALTNSIRDIMNGDFISGTARLVEALITAVAVAAGVGIILSIFNWLGGFNL